MGAEDCKTSGVRDSAEFPACVPSLALTAEERALLNDPAAFQEGDDGGFQGQSRHPAARAAGSAERAAAYGKIASMAAARVRFHIPKEMRGADDRHCKLWAENQTSSLLGLDYVMSAHVPLSKVALQGQEDASLSPGEVARQTKYNLETLVLATVNCAAWRKNWIAGFLTTIITAYRSSSLLVLEAIKGGPATNCEIRFIEEAMHLLGFQVPVFRADRGRFLTWRWTLERPGGEELVVRLYQYKSVDVVEVEGDVAWDLRAERKHAMAPNLKSVAVASCPLKDKDDNPVHDTLNTKLNEGLDYAIRHAEAKGWYENW